MNHVQFIIMTSPYLLGWISLGWFYSSFKHRDEPEVSIMANNIPAQGSRHWPQLLRDMLNHLLKFDLLMWKKPGPNYNFIYFTEQWWLLPQHTEEDRRKTDSWTDLISHYLAPYLRFLMTHTNFSRDTNTDCGTVVQWLALWPHSRGSWVWVQLTDTESFPHS